MRPERVWGRELGWKSFSNHIVGGTAEDPGVVTVNGQGSDRDLAIQVVESPAMQSPKVVT